ncbi:MAG: RNA pseudouridine synthase [Desulfobacteraceae bacterium]|nr:RNA pseudouridine synthase [Desulfobacteraceae bacterium]
MGIAVSEEIPIVGETDDYVLAWKEANLPTTRTEAHPDCLITHLIRKRPDLSGVVGYSPDEFGLLNRLDNRTVGVVMIAKTQDAFERLSRQFHHEQWTKLYLAYCYNLGNQDKGIIDIPIAHHSRKAKKMVLVQNNTPYRGKPQPCTTRFEKISDQQARELWTFYTDDITGFPIFPVDDKSFSWVFCKITSGKRHQIRLHLRSVDIRFWEILCISRL